MTKTAIIGVGKWGKNLLRELNEQSQVVYACHTGSAFANNEVGKYPSIRSTTSIDEVLGDGSVEAVAIATPTSTHFEIAKKALEAGKHVLLEKPGTESRRDLEELSLRAKQKGLRLALGYVFVHHPACKKLGEIIGGRKVKSIRFEWHKKSSFENDMLPHLASHHLAVLGSWGFIPAEEVVRYNTTFTGLSRFPDIIDISLFADQANIDIVVDRVSPHSSHTCLVVLEEGESYLWHGDNLSKIVALHADNPSEIFEPVKLPETTALEEEIQEFVSSIEKGTPLLTDSEMGLSVWRQIEQIRKQK